jgi:hypothetical protein
LADFKWPLRFRVTSLTRSEHEGHPVSWSLTLQPDDSPIGGHNLLSFHIEGDLPENVELGSRFELVPLRPPLRQPGPGG